MRKLLTLLLLFCFLACQSESQEGGIPNKVKLITPRGDSIKTTLALTPAQQEKGLSGVKPGDFDEDQGMLFFNLQDGEKHFWMPDTYFDLDLIYLNRDLRILDIIRRLPHHKGWANPDLIPRARPVWARHVLEMKSGSPISSSLKIGDQLKWDGDLTLEETENKLRELLKN